MVTRAKLGEIKPDSERRGIAGARRRESSQQHRAAVVVRRVDHVVLVARVAGAARAVRRDLEDRIGHGVVEENLRCELKGLRASGERPNLEMNVNRSPLVPARIDGRELCHAGGIGHLVAAEEFLARRVVRRDIRVDPAGVAVPDVHLRAAQRRAASRSDSSDGECEGQRYPRPSRAIGRVARDVRSEEHTSELQSPCNLVCRLLLEKKKKKKYPIYYLIKKKKK